MVFRKIKEINFIKSFILYYVEELQISLINNPIQ